MPFDLTQISRSAAELSMTDKTAETILDPLSGWSDQSRGGGETKAQRPFYCHEEDLH